MKAVIRAEIANFSASDLRSMIPDGIMARIKALDPSPEFRAYCIAHEGEANGREVGGWRSVQKYYRYAIRKVHAALQYGTGIFLGHEETNEHRTKQIGEVVGKALQEIDGRLSAIMAAYIYPQFRAMKLDVASFEAMLEMVMDGADALVQDVEQITGVALGDSSVDTPGFPGATLLATVQNFAAGAGERQGQMPLTVKDIRAAIEAGELTAKPSDLFTEEQLTEDPAFIKLLKAEKQTEYEHARRVEKALGEERVKNATMAEELAALHSQVNAAKTRAVFERLASERKLTDAQKQFMAADVDSFSSDAKNDKDFEVAVARLIDGGIARFRETAKLFGVDVDKQDTEQSPPQKTGDGTTPPPLTEKDFTDPAKNPFIAGGEAAAKLA